MKIDSHKNTSLLRMWTRYNVWLQLFWFWLYSFMQIHGHGIQLLLNSAFSNFCMYCFISVHYMVIFYPSPKLSIKKKKMFVALSF